MAFSQTKSVKKWNELTKLWYLKLCLHYKLLLHNNQSQNSVHSNNATIKQPYISCFKLLLLSIKIGAIQLISSSDCGVWHFAQINVWLKCYRFCTSLTLNNSAFRPQWRRSWKYPSNMVAFDHLFKSSDKEIEALLVRFIFLYTRTHVRGEYSTLTSSWINPATQQFVLSKLLSVQFDVLHITSSFLTLQNIFCMSLWTETAGNMISNVCKRKI